MQTNRRDFLRKAGVFSVGMGFFPAIIKASALGRDGHMAPSDKINMIAIGVGSMGQSNLHEFLKHSEVQVVAICDVDDNHLAATKKLIDEAYGNNDCRVYKDFREILEKEDADAAMLALPDHWHAIVACSVANKKIDIYGEKPMARSIVESRAILDAVQRNEVIWQTGSWQRSHEHFHKACELVRNGRIGQVDFVEVGLPNGGHYVGNPGVRPLPEGLDWEMWLGPAPAVPFRGVVHWNWRWIDDYSGGQLTDWAGHHIDIAHWGLGLDRSGPVSIEGTGRRNNDGIYNVFAEYDFTCMYENGVKMRVANQAKTQQGMGTYWKGSDGWIHVWRGGLKASDDTILNERIGQNEIRLYKSNNHVANFLQCIRSREETITSAPTAHSAITAGLLGEIAMKTGQKLLWDPKTERFTDNNPHASRLLRRPYRAPWTLPA